MRAHCHNADGKSSTKARARDECFLAHDSLLQRVRTLCFQACPFTATRLAAWTDTPDASCSRTRRPVPLGRELERPLFQLSCCDKQIKRRVSLLTAFNDVAP